MDKTTVHGLFVFLFFGLETTISSNMVLPPPGWSKAPCGDFAVPGFVSGCGSGSCARFLVFPTMPPDHKRSSNAKTGVRSYHNPHHQGKGECAKHLAAHQEQNEHSEERQTAGKYRSRQRLIDGLVHDSGKILF